MWPNLQETSDLVTFTEEILNMENLIFCAVFGVLYCKQKLCDDLYIWRKFDRNLMQILNLKFASNLFEHIIRKDLYETNLILKRCAFHFVGFQSAYCFYLQSTAKKSFSLRISSVHVTKSAVSCGFGHIYWRTL